MKKILISIVAAFIILIGCAEPAENAIVEELLSAITVTFDPNGAGGHSVQQQFYANTSQSLLRCKFRRDGYSFIG